MNVNNPQYPPMPPQGGVDPGRKRKFAIYGTLTGIAVCIAILLGLSAAGMLKFQSFGISSGHLKAQGEGQGPGMLNAQSSPGPAMLEAKGEQTEPGTLSAEGEAKGPGMLQAQPADGSAPVLTAKGVDTGPGLLQPKTESGPGVLAAPTPAKIEMPADVRDWLEHLHRTEVKRSALATDQVSEAITMLSTLRGVGDLGGLLGDEAGSGGVNHDPSAARKAAQDADRMRTEWVRLIQFFNSKKPPAECQNLHDGYDQVIRETGNMIGEIISIVMNMGDDAKGAISKLQNMQGKSKNRIDVPAAKVDDGVKEICKKYETKKWFDIKPDFGGGLAEKLGL